MKWYESKLKSVGVLAEVYAALTWIDARPTQTPEVASNTVRLLATNPSAIRVLETGLDAGNKMLELAATYRLTARRIHDARHAATALVAGVRHVYTYDVDDWQVFEPDGIVIKDSKSRISSVE